MHRRGAPVCSMGVWGSCECPYKITSYLMSGIARYLLEQCCVIGVHLQNEGCHQQVDFFVSLARFVKFITVEL